MPFGSLVINEIKNAKVINAIQARTDHHYKTTQEKLLFNLACILYCGCFNLFRNVWVCVSVGVLVICVLVFTVFCIVCTVFLYCFVYVYLLLFVLSVLL